MHRSVELSLRYHSQTANQDGEYKDQDDDKLIRTSPVTPSHGKGLVAYLRGVQAGEKIEAWHEDQPQLSGTKPALHRSSG